MNDMETNQSSDFNSGTSTTTGATMEQTKESLASKARAKGATLKESAREATARAKEKSSEMMHEARNQGRTFVDTRKAELGEKICGCGGAVRRAAEKLREEQDPNIAEYADLVAGKIEAAGNYVRNNDFSAIMRDVEGVARRRPELVFGGMFIAGLAVARFLKASQEQDYYAEDAEADYWVEDDYDTEEVMGAPVVADPMPAAPSQGTGSSQGMGSTTGTGTPQGAGGTPAAGGTTGYGGTSPDPWVRGTGGQN